MTWPALLLWLVILAAGGRALAGGRDALLLAMFCATMVFGSLTMLPPGGLNLPAQTICSALLIATTFIQRRHLQAGLAMAFDLRQLGFLFLFLLYALFSAVFLSRLFAGLVRVVPLNNTPGGVQPMTPTSANFTQAVYLTLAVAIAFVFAIKGRSPAFRTQYLRAVLLTGGLLIGSGVADLALTLAGRSALLAPFHNAHYALLTDVKEAGQLRVVGLMPEASTFGAACVSVLALLIFCYDAFEARHRRRLLPATIVGLIAMTYLSTSSTGFIGFLVMALILCGTTVLRQLLLGRLRRRALLVVAGVTASAGLVYVYALSVAPALIRAAARLLNSVLFDKAQSSSYLERLAWTRAGIAAFLRTHGIGIGIGSLRTSDWLVNLLASTGVLGALLFAAAVAIAIGTLRRQRDPQLRRFGRGLICASLPIGTMLITSGTTPDPGAFNMAILGLLVAVSRSQQPAVAATQAAAEPTAPTVP